MIGLILAATGAAMAWFIVKRGDDLELSDDVQKLVTWSAYAIGGLGVLLLVS